MQVRPSSLLWVMTPVARYTSGLRTTGNRGPTLVFKLPYYCQITQNICLNFKFRGRAPCGALFNTIFHQVCFKKPSLSLKHILMITIRKSVRLVPGAVLAQKFWGGALPPSAPSSPSPFSLFSKTEKYQPHIQCVAKKWHLFGIWVFYPC